MYIPNLATESEIIKAFSGYTYIKLLFLILQWQAAKF